MKIDVMKSNDGGGHGLPHPADLEKRVCISVKEVSEMLGISRNNTYELVKKGIIPSIKLGKRIIIPRIQLEKMLNC